MARPSFYVQCELKKQISEDVYKLDMAWIPEKFAILNNIIKIKKDGKWDSGWKVIYIGAKMKAEIVEANERDYLKQRKASDI